MYSFFNMNFIIPDILLLLFPFIVIGSRLFCNYRSQLPWRIANFGFIAIFILLNFIPLASGEGRFFICNWKIDDFGVLMREVLIVSAILGIWLSKDYFEHGADGKPQMHQIAEFIGAIAFATFGGVTVVSACDLLTFFLGLEIATIPMYALTAWNKKDQLGSEAATKYILMGSVATAFELFGFSYLYGFAGSLHFGEIQQAIATGTSPLLWVAVLFLFCGIGFKLTLFPFYTWAPDVYEGAPTPVTAVLSVTSKATAIAFLVVLVFGPLAPVQEQIAPLIALLPTVPSPRQATSWWPSSGPHPRQRRPSSTTCSCTRYRTTSPSSSSASSGTTAKKRSPPCAGFRSRTRASPWHSRFRCSALQASRRLPASSGSSTCSSAEHLRAITRWSPSPS